MRPHTDPRQATFDLLDQHGAGVSLPVLLKTLFAFHDPERVCQELDALVASGQACMAPSTDNPDEGPLLFRLVRHAPALPQADTDAVRQLMGLLSQNQDGRGDFDPCMGVIELLRRAMRRAPRFAMDDWLSAMRLLFEEQLVQPCSRKNGYVTVTLAPTTCYTVIGVDMANGDPYRFVVRAGSPTIALAKVVKDMGQVPQLRCLCVLKDAPDTGDVEGTTPVEHIFL